MFPRNLNNQPNRKQRVLSPRQAQNEKNGTAYLNSNGLPDIPYQCDWHWERQDEVLGMMYIDGKRYRTFNAGEILIYDHYNNPVICFKVDGYLNDQRSINYVKVSTHIDLDDVIIYYLKHSDEDLYYFQKWVNEQLHGGKLMREVQHFIELLDEIDLFNRFLATRNFRYKGGRFMLYHS